MPSCLVSLKVFRNHLSFSSPRHIRTKNIHIKPTCKKKKKKGNAQNENHYVSEVDMNWLKTSLQYEIWKAKIEWSS